MKRTIAGLLLLAFSLLVILPVALPSGVSAQSSGYIITQVDHQVQVMYSGHVVILDTIHVSGQVADGFMIGLPYKYSANVLKTIAYDDTHIYQMNLGIQFGNRSGFYGTTVDFNGNSPSVFTVAFVLSNRLVSELGNGVSSLDFPAYPSLAQDVGTCNVSITFPSTPTAISITKDDGNVNDAVYTRTDLPAYTYAPATATFQVPVRTIQLSTLSSLDREISIDPTGKVTATDSYRIINNSTSLLNSFVVSLPLEATNVAIKDQFSTLTASLVTSADGKMLLANATLVTFLSNGQSTVLNAEYNLPSSTIQGDNYALSSFSLFPSFSYYVNQATITFMPPEGATIVKPQSSGLDSSSTLTRQIYQDTLTVTKNGLSYVDYLPPHMNTIQFAFNYNPVWVSFRPTFWASILAVVGCVAVFFVRNRRPKEETYAEKTERLSTLEPEKPETTQPAKVSVVKPVQRVSVSADTIRDFIDAYEDKKQLKNELKSMDSKAQRGRIPRPQYKVQRRAIEVRLEGINRHIERTKNIFKGTTGTYGDLVRQLDLAEADLEEAEENIRNLESQQSTGEISLETYKESIGDYKKQKDKAESAINGILLRLREKIR
ncbi:MAG TPA: hypothetical protein VK253_00500 [Candidatus Binatia bacterium]|nr:hypothetical protein [Candidatus Binatia bacterium]